MTMLTEEEVRFVSIAKVAMSNETAELVRIIERLAGTEIIAADEIAGDPQS